MKKDDEKFDYVMELIEKLRKRFFDFNFKYDVKLDENIEFEDNGIDYKNVKEINLTLTFSNAVKFR